MTYYSPPTATLLAECPDQPGLIAKVTQFLCDNHGNIVDLEQHVDTANKRFFMRVQWQLDHFKVPADKINAIFKEQVGTPLNKIGRAHV